MGSSREDLFRGFTRVVRSYVELRIVIEAGPATMTGVEAGYPWHARQWPCGQSLGTCAKGGLILKYFWRFWSGFLPDVASFVPELLITYNRELISPLHRCELRPCLRSLPATESAFVLSILSVISTLTAEHEGVIHLIFSKKERAFQSTISGSDTQQQTIPGNLSRDIQPDGDCGKGKSQNNSS